MGTLTGDLLRLLAHGVANVGTNYLGAMLTEPIKEQALAKRAAVGELVKTLPLAPKAAMPAIAAKIKELSGVEWPTYQAETGNVISPEGEKLAMTPVAGAPVTPEMETRYVQPPPNLGHVLGAAAKESPGLALKMLGAKSGDITPAIEAKLAEVARGHDIRQYLGELSDQTRNRLAEISDQSRRDINDMRLEQQKFQNAQTLNEKIREFDLRSEKGVADKEADAANKMHVKMKDLYTKIYPNDAKKKVKPEQQYELIQEYNKYVNMGNELYPKHFKEFQEIPATKTPGKIWGYNYEIGSPPSPVTPTGPAAPAAPGATPEATKTVVKTGTVQSGPNKGKRVTVYSDGTQTYE